MNEHKRQNLAHVRSFFNIFQLQAAGWELGTREGEAEVRKAGSRLTATAESETADTGERNAAHPTRQQGVRQPY